MNKKMIKREIIILIGLVAMATTDLIFLLTLLADEEFAIVNLLGVVFISLLGMIKSSFTIIIYSIDNMILEMKLKENNNK